MRILSVDAGKWLLKNKEYVSWSQSTSSDLLWIKGKPGSGKSTLAKQIAQIIRSQTRNSAIAEFYYSFRGGVAETSHELMLRSIAHQIWVQNTTLWPSIRERYRQIKARHGEQTSGRPFWEYEDLKVSLQSLLQLDFALRIFIIVDGMDESDSDRQNDVLNLLLNLSRPIDREKPIIFKVLVASRPETRILIRLDDSHQIVLQDVNQEDIQKAIEKDIGEIACARRSSPEVLSRIKKYLMENSAGVFLWVSLVLAELRRLVQGGAYTMAGLEKRARSLPKELGGPAGFYKSIVNSLIKRQGEDETWDEE